MFKKIAISLALLSLQSCVKLPQEQKSKLQAVKTTMPEHYIEAKNPNLAAGLAVLPLGIADFYNENYGLAVANIFGSILWPINLSWTIIGGIDGANEKNYYATKSHLKKVQTKEIDILQDKLERKEINAEKFASESRKIEKKYDMENMM